MIRVNENTPSAGGGPNWTWNGSVDKPTFSPSVLCRATHRLTDEEYDRVMAGEVIEPRPLVCHCFVRDGVIEFLADCTHRFAGMKVAMELSELEVFSDQD